MLVSGKIAFNTAQVKTYFILCVLIVLNIDSIRSQSINPRLAAMLEDTLNFYTSSITNIKGMSAAVYLPNQGIWQSATGLSYANNPLTTDMLQGIASNTKLFVATVILKLAESKKLSLSDSVRRWLPPYKNVNANITLRQLLNHTSGLSEPIFASPWMDTILAHPTRVFTPEEVVSWLGPPVAAPGKSWNYSNVNYVIAGMIAEKATGTHISKLIRDSILTPLGLNHTFYDVREKELGTIAHRWWNNIDYHDTSRIGLNTAGGCAGALFSTSSDMVKWYHSLLNGQLISAASMKEMTTFVNTTSPGMTYGLGIDRETTLGISYWGHGGSTWGYRSKMIYDSCMKVSVCGLTNSYPSGMEGVMFLLYRVVRNHVPSCPEAIIGPSRICRGTQNVTYKISSVANASSYIWELPPGTSGSSNSNTITLNFTKMAQSGTLRVHGAGVYGEGASVKLDIYVDTVPTNIKFEKGNLLAAIGADSYQWIDCSQGGKPVVGETGPVFTPNTSGNYAVIVSSGGCTDTSTCLQVIITQLDDTKRLTLHINTDHASGNIIFQCDALMNRISIFDLTGKLIAEKKSCSYIEEMPMPQTLICFYQIAVPGHGILQGKILCFE